MAKTQSQSRRSSGKGKSRANEEGTSVGATSSHHLSSREKDLLKNETATKRYSSDFMNREFLIGRYVDFNWMQNQDDINIDMMMINCGWANFLEVKEIVYPKLVKILYANLDLNSMKSWIGNIEVDLGINAWAEAFGLMNCSDENERTIMEISKEELFRNLNGKRGQGHKLWINSNELPHRLDDRLLANILMNGMIPKKGSKEQLREEEARILYSMKYGLEYNIARDVVKRIVQVFIRKSTPLVYPMQLMALMKRAGVNVKSAGDNTFEEIPVSMYINEKTPSRLGFKKDGNYWSYLGKGKSKYTGESAVGDEQETRGEERQEERREEDLGGESSIPHTHTSRQAFPQNQTHISHHLAVFEAQLLPKIANLIAEQLTPFHTGMRTLNSRLDELQTEIRSMASSQTRPPSSQPIPPHQSSPIPPSAPTPQSSHQQPFQPSSHPEPQQPAPPSQRPREFYDLTDPLQPMSFNPDHFTASFLHTPPPHPNISPPQPQQPSSHPDPDSEATPSASPPPQPAQEPTPQIPSTTEPPALRTKKMAIRPKRKIMRFLEPSQDSNPGASPSTLAAEVPDSSKKPPTFYIRKRAKTSPEDK